MIRRNLPRTLTVTVAPGCLGQPGTLQVMSMSVGAMAIIDPLVSFWIAADHAVGRLVAGLVLDVELPASSTPGTRPRGRRCSGVMFA